MEAAGIELDRVSDPKELIEFSRQRNLQKTQHTCQSCTRLVQEIKPVGTGIAKYLMIAMRT